MRKIVIPKHGGPDVLRLVEEDMPDLASDKLRIDVELAGINWADVMMRMGLYPEAPKPPFTPGYEVVGKVAEVGDDVKGFRKGQPVIAGTRFGGYASCVDVDPSSAVKRPKALDAQVACALPVQGVTAWAALVGHGRIRAGDKVLVHGGAGGVGLIAIALAHRHGAEVYATVGSQDKVNFLESECGVKQAFLRDGDWHNVLRDMGGMDIVLDPIGGEHLHRSRRCLAPFGRVVAYGLSSAVTGDRRNPFTAIKAARAMKKNVFKLMTRNVGVSGLNVLTLQDQTDVSAGLDELATDIVRNKMQPPRVDQVFDLADAADAHRHMQARGNKGKILLRCD